MGQTSESSGGVRMMRGRDELLQSLSVCECVGSAIKDILSGKSIKDDASCRFECFGFMQQPTVFNFHADTCRFKQLHYAI